MMHAKKVKDIMHTGVTTCLLNTPIPEVARTMEKNDVSAIVVTDETGYLAGLISRTDLVVLYGYQEMWPHMIAEQVMVSKVATISPDELATKAAQKMNQQKYHRLIVTNTDDDGNQKPIGVVSMTDIVRDMALA
jgi:CBS domain-containing protein